MTKKTQSIALHTLKLGALPVAMAEQLQTASGAKALAGKCDESIEDADPRDKHKYRKQAQAALQMAGYLAYVEKVQDIEKVIARDKAAAAQEFDACNVELADAVNTQNECRAVSASIAIKVEDSQATVTEQEQKLNDAVQTAREAFNTVMKGDDDDAQRLAAEHLSQAETALHLAKQSSPDVLRLKGFMGRAVQASEAVQAADELVETAQEALHQAALQAVLVDLDASTNHLLLDYARTLNALADCKQRPYLNGLESVVLWFSTGKRFASPAVQMSDASVVIAQQALAQPARALRMPDLSVFSEKA